MNLMTIAGDFMHQLPELPNGLLTLEAETNGLAALPPLPPNLTDLFVSENLLTELPPLPPTLTYLRAHTNRLTRLPPLPASLESLNVRRNSLESLPVPLPPNLRITEEGLMENPWNPLFAWFLNRFAELYHEMGWQQEAQVQQLIRQELNTEVQRLANLRQKGRNVSAANQTLQGLIPRNVLGGIMGFLSGESGAPKVQTLKLREKATRPHRGPGVGGRRRTRKGRKAKRSSTR
jgi:Leucine-rich repeat (LRR) protein